MTSIRARLLALIETGELGAAAPNRAYADQLGCSERTIARHLADLADLGAIIIVRRSPNLGGPGTDPTGRSIFISETSPRNDEHTEAK
jgi:hypothetical protein